MEQQLPAGKRHLPLTEKGRTPRYILQMLRRDGYLTEKSKGRVRVQDDDSVIEIQNKSTGEPLLALMLTHTYEIKEN